MLALNLNPPALISQMLGLQVSTTTLSLFTLLDNKSAGPCRCWAEHSTIELHLWPTMSSFIKEVLPSTAPK